MRSRFRPSPAMVVACIALFVALGGGAYALSGSNTVQSDDLGPGAQVKAADVADNAVRGPDVKDGSLGLADLNAGSRPHMLDYSVPSSDPPPKTTIAKVGNVQLSGQCTLTPSLYIWIKNVTGQTGTMNVSMTTQDQSNGPVGVRSSGQFIGAGDEFTLDGNDDTITRPTAINGFNRVEGQLVFRTPGRVTTIAFHAFTTANGGSRCEFYGTGVTSNQS